MDVRPLPKCFIKGIGVGKYKICVYALNGVMKVITRGKNEKSQIKTVS